MARSRKSSEAPTKSSGGREKAEAETAASVASRPGSKSPASSKGAKSTGMKGMKQTTAGKALSSHGGTRKKMYSYNTRRSSAIYGAVRESARSLSVRNAGPAPQALEDPRALALQASQRVVRNHLDTISIVLTKANEVATLFGVPAAVLNHWPTQRLPDPLQRDRIRQFADLVSLLLQRFPPPVAAGWLREYEIPVTDGGGTPLGLLREEKWHIVRAYAEEAVSEAYG